MYVWDESAGSRGPREIASCLLKHLTTQPVKSHVVAYSDSCGGQNRNIRMAVFWLHVVSSPEIPIDWVDHKFFVSGHSYMDSDKDFGVIEKAKKHTPSVMVPDDWVHIIQNAKQSNKFKVTKLTSADIFDTRALEEEITHRKVDTGKNKVEWLKIQWLQFRHTDPQIFFKYSNQEVEAFRCIDVGRRASRGRPQGASNIGTKELQLLYPRGRAIQEAKYRDLQELLPLIPPVHHVFYVNLRHDKDAADGGTREEQDMGNP